MPVRTAACHCGQLVLHCDGEPAKVSLCHCRDCQRRTGSVFSIAAFFDRQAVHVGRGSYRTFERASASGFRVAFHFCGDCGANLFWEPRRLPELIGVAVGAFADPDFPRPEQAVWAKDQHAWLELPAAIPSHDRNPVRPAGQ